MPDYPRRGRRLAQRLDGDLVPSGEHPSTVVQDELHDSTRHRQRRRHGAHVLRHGAGDIICILGLGLRGFDDEKRSHVERVMRQQKHGEYLGQWTECLL